MPHPTSPKGEECFPSLAKKYSNEKQNTIKKGESPLLLFLSSFSSNPQLWGKRLLEVKVLFIPKLFQRCMGNLSRKGV